MQLRHTSQHLTHITRGDPGGTPCPHPQRAPYAYLDRDDELRDDGQNLRAARLQCWVQHSAAVVWSVRPALIGHICSGPALQASGHWRVNKHASDTSCATSMCALEHVCRHVHIHACTGTSMPSCNGHMCAIVPASEDTAGVLLLMSSTHGTHTHTHTHAHAHAHAHTPSRHAPLDACGRAAP